MSDFKASWAGEEKLWKVFWIYNVLFGTLISLATDYVGDPSIVVFLLLTIAILTWVIWVTVSLWRCAFNTAWRGWGYIARATVVFTVCMIVIMIIAVMTGVDLGET